MRYSIPQIEKMLDGMQIIVDTREQDTEQLHKRIEGFNRPFVRQKLSYGDYSALYTDCDGESRSLESISVIERKMSLDEICTCFTKDRERFKREFERSNKTGCRVHLIIENDNYEKLFAGRYRSKLNPQSLIASMLSWSIRYNIHAYFCKPETTGKLIAEIMKYELREYLLNAEEAGEDDAKRSDT